MSDNVKSIQNGTAKPKKRTAQLITIVVGAVLAIAALYLGIEIEPDTVETVTGVIVDVIPT